MVARLMIHCRAGYFNDAAKGVDVLEIWHVGQRDGAVRQKGRRHEGEGRILRSADGQGSSERVSPADDELVHELLNIDRFVPTDA